ncbi:hypothetical protein HDU79_009064 [Rhizoclosmatium sp. JEL0117]|nr:hypothetical protein HDU79_009064 [Rhizoclosmatium sp. JEL0117]
MSDSLVRLGSHTVSLQRFGRSVKDTWTPASEYFTPDQRIQLEGGVYDSIGKFNPYMAAVVLSYIATVITVISVAGKTLGTPLIVSVVIFGWFLIFVYMLWELQQHLKAVQMVCDSWRTQGIVFKCQIDYLPYFIRPGHVAIDVQAFSA